MVKFCIIVCQYLLYAEELLDVRWRLHKKAYPPWAKGRSAGTSNALATFIMNEGLTAFRTKE